VQRVLRRARRVLRSGSRSGRARGPLGPPPAWAPVSTMPGRTPGSRPWLRTLEHGEVTSRPWVIRSPCWRSSPRSLGRSC